MMDTVRSYIGSVALGVTAFIILAITRSGSFLVSPISVLP